MAMVLVFSFAIHFGIGLFVVRLLVRPREHWVWFSVAMVVWALLPQIYWGAHTFRDYLSFREVCRTLDVQVYRNIPDFGVPLIQVADGAPSWQAWVGRVVGAAYTDGWPYGKTLQEWTETPKDACPDIRGERLYQAFRPSQGCYRRIAVNQIDAKYKISTQRSSLLPERLSTFTNAFRQDYAIHERSGESSRVISEWTQITLNKKVPWNFLLLPWSGELATCTSNGIDRRRWLDILANGEPL